MTTLGLEQVECSVCGYTSKHTVIRSTNACGSPDLDFRPPEMERSTMKYWVQRCPTCGYCSGSLKNKTSVDKAYLSSDEYKALFANIQEDSLAAAFIRQARIAEKDKSYNDAMHAYLYAAWSCDDMRYSEGAKQCRLLALKLLDDHYDEIVAFSDEDSIACLKTDMLRRAGCFEEAIVIAQNHLSKTNKDIVKQILNFQIAISNFKYTKQYCISDTNKLPEKSFISKFFDRILSCLNWLNR